MTSTRSRRRSAGTRLHPGAAGRQTDHRARAARTRPGAWPKSRSARTASARWRSSSPTRNGGANSTSAAPRRSSRCSSSSRAASAMVNRGRAMHSRAMERAMAEQGELQQGSNMGAGQVKAADYFLQPDIVSANQNSGGSGLGAARRAHSAACSATGGGFGRRARRRDQRQEGRGQRHADAGQRPHHRGRSADRRLFPQARPQLRASAAAAAGGAASRRPAAAATRIPRSARSSCSPISTPTRSW